MASDDDFAVSFAVQARLSALRFDDDARSVHATFADGGAESIVTADQIVSLRGARIRNEVIGPVTLTGRADPSRVLMVPAIGSAANEVIEELSYALALRIRDVAELWYLVADSFNFRTALGSDAGLTTEPNFRALVARLASIAPAATHDAFVDAVLAHTQLPAPVETLVEFFKAAAV